MYFYAKKSTIHKKIYILIVHKKELLFLFVILYHFFLYIQYHVLCFLFVFFKKIQKRNGCAQLLAVLMNGIGL